MGGKHQPKAVVFACRGGAQGDLGIVRTLGRAGVHVTLVSEYKNAIALHSKYTKESYVLPGFTNNYDKTLEFLIDYSRKQEEKPVLFPTADPDLKMISDLRDSLTQYYIMFISEKEIIEGFMDKAEFFKYAEKYGFPIPATMIPSNRDDVIKITKDLNFPVIIKPVYPHSWVRQEIQIIVDNKKALKVDDKESLVKLYEDISIYNQDMVIQEYIPGRDDHLYSLHIYMDKNSRPKGYFTGRKLRTYPAYAGIGCFVESIRVPEIIEQGINLLQKVGYTGLALMQFKKDPRFNDYKLIEINPRASSWNLLAYECGINLPYMAYCDALNQETSVCFSQTEGIKYIYFEHDLRAFLEYHKDGELTLPDWLNSYRGKKVYQYYASDDLGPFWKSVKLNMGLLFNRIFPRH